VRSAIRRMMRVRSTTSRSSSASSTTCCTARDRTGFGCHRGHVRFSRPRVRAGTARSTSDRTGTDLLAQAPTRSLRRGPCQVSSRPVDESATRQPRGAGHYWGQAGWENSAIQHPCHYRVVTPAAVFGWRSAREWQRGTCAGEAFQAEPLARALLATRGPPEQAPGPRTIPQASEVRTWATRALGRGSARWLKGSSWTMIICGLTPACWRGHEATGRSPRVLVQRRVQ